jgi:hypothetical protein
VCSQAVNGNSKLSTKKQHGYEIVDANGNVMEYGISGQKLTNNGTTSPRIAQKLRTKYGNKPGFKGRVMEPNMANRQTALNWEQGKVNDFYRSNGFVPDMQLRPIPK